MATPQLEVFFPDGTQQSFPLVGERVVVGTSERCQVRLDRPELSPEHIALSPRPDGCWVAVARGTLTPTVVDGQNFERGMLPWGGSLSIGSIKFLLADGARAAKKSSDDKAKKEEKTSPIVLIAAAVVVPICLYMTFQDPVTETPHHVSAPPPEIFDPLQRPCPQADPALITPTAVESTRIALSKAERMPFRTQDGIDAVNYYAQAAACYQAAGDANNARLALAQATVLHDRIEDDYRAHRFRLDRALEQERIEDALYEVKMLTALTAHRRGPYLTALTALERQLTLRIDQAAAAAR